MIQSQLKYYADLLQAESYKAYYLAFLRVAISCWLLKEVFINWDSMAILYSNASFVVLKTNQFGKVTGLVLAMLRNHYQLFIIDIPPLLF